VSVILQPWESNKRICAALGLDANKVLALTMRWTVKDVTTAEVLLRIDNVQADGVQTELKRYKLVPLAEEPKRGT